VARQLGELRALGGELKTFDPGADRLPLGLSFEGAAQGAQLEHRRRAPRGRDRAPALQIGGAPAALDMPKCREQQGNVGAAPILKRQTRCGHARSSVQNDGETPQIGLSRAGRRPCYIAPHMDDPAFEEIRRNIAELRSEHRDLDDVIARVLEHPPVDMLQVQRLKKRKLALKDQIARLESRLLPDIIA
jgi:hypothetical protein